MKDIASKDKALIRKYAQKIKPTFQVGAMGIHDLNIAAIKEGFNKKEVLKVKVNREDKTDKQIVKDVANNLQKELNCVIAGVIGTTIILYKENLNIDKENRIL